MTDAFEGAKIAIIAGQDVLAILRDDYDWIRCPNHWDLPGGERDPGEAPLETVTGELYEELAVRLEPDRIVLHETFPSLSRPGMAVHFYVARWAALRGAAITLGDEGQEWRWMPLSEFLTRDDAVPELQARLACALHRQDLA